MGVKIWRIDPSCAPFPLPRNATASADVLRRAVHDMDRAMQDGSIIWIIPAIPQIRGFYFEASRISLELLGRRMDALKPRRRGRHGEEA